MLGRQRFWRGSWRGRSHGSLLEPVAAPRAGWHARKCCGAKLQAAGRRIQRKPSARRAVRAGRGLLAAQPPVRRAPRCSPPGCARLHGTHHPRMYSCRLRGQTLLQVRCTSKHTLPPLQASAPSNTKGTEREADACAAFGGHRAQHAHAPLAAAAPCASVLCRRPTYSHLLGCYSDNVRHSASCRAMRLFSCSPRSKASGQ